MQLPSDGKQRIEGKAKKESPMIVDSGWHRERAPKESHAVSNNDVNKKGKR